MTSVSLLLVVVLWTGVDLSWGRSVVDGEGRFVESIRPESYKGLSYSAETVNSTGYINRGIEQKALDLALLDEQLARGIQEWLNGEGKEEEEGRHHKRRRKMLARLAVWLQAIGFGVVLPSVLALALFAAWKGVTISLMALMLAGIVGLKGLVASASKSSSRPHHVILSGVPTHHQHYWKRVDTDASSWGDSAHHLAYRSYS